MSSDSIGTFLRAIAGAKIPREVPDTCDHAEDVRILIGFLHDVQCWLKLLSEGNLSFEVNLRGPFAGSIKALQASLKHLTWQTQRVAEGDFVQRVDFMGDFAVSFNMMVENLKTARDTITQRNRDLETAYEQLKESQNQLLQHEKLASIGQIAAGIAHEINNPLAFMYANMNRFDEYFGDVLSALRSWQEFGRELEEIPAFRERLAVVHEEEQRVELGYIIEDFGTLLDHSRIGALRIQNIVNGMRGFADSERQAVCMVDLNNVIDGALADVKPELRQGMSVVKEYGEIEGVACKPDEMKLAFVHLLRNAAQATDHAGEIRVSTSAEGRRVCATIRDTGCGIPPENLTRVFNPFFTTKPVGKGVGLGLWIVSTIVHSAKGTVSIDSEVNKGTTVTLLFSPAGSDKKE